MFSEKTPVDGEGASGGLKAKLAARFKKRSERESREEGIYILTIYCS